MLKKAKDELNQEKQQKLLMK